VSAVTVSASHVAPVGDEKLKMPDALPFLKYGPNGTIIPFVITKEPFFLKIGYGALDLPSTILFPQWRQDIDPRVLCQGRDKIRDGWRHLVEEHGFSIEKDLFVEPLKEMVFCEMIIFRHLANL
jgi:hypothetical protein